MAVPRNRLSNSRKNLRRSHHARQTQSLNACSNCGKSRSPHRICGVCGYYGNRPVVAMKEKEEE